MSLTEVGILAQEAPTQDAPHEQTTSGSEAVPEAKQKGLEATNACLEEKQNELVQRVQGGGARPSQDEITQISIECFDKYTEAVAGEAVAEVKEEKSGAQMILPAWQELIPAALAFLVLFVLLAKFAFPAMKRALQKRSDQIQDDLTKAEEAKLEAESVLDDYRAQLANARGDAARIIEESRKQADELRRDALAKAEEEARAIREAGARDVAGAVDSAKAELRQQVADLSIELAGRLVGAQLDRSGHEQLIDEFIRDLDSTGAKP
ncbi:MAG: F0F1 ATP synthase subunit B [Acidimicrobiia bacterium]|nr:F0F1 ATP synthase subunit B [Acidimicrobiia bacterium]